MTYDCRVELRPGQRWRDPNGANVPVIEIDEIDGSTVRGTMTYEEVRGPVAAGAWSPAEFERMTLLEDVYPVLVNGNWKDLEVKRRMEAIGSMAEATTGEPWKGQMLMMSRWEVPAPSEQEALQRVEAVLAGLPEGTMDPSSVRIKTGPGRF